MASTSVAKRNFLTLSEKLAILKESDSFHGSKIELAKKSKIPVTTLQYIFKKRESTEKLCNNLGKSATKRKTLKISSYEETENVILKWYGTQMLKQPKILLMVYKSKKKLKK